MAEKITRTHAERDALLSKVFDSTLQTKDIEITEAGTMEITPDEGYFALKKVNLNVNVQGGGGSIEYLDVSGLDSQTRAVLLSLAIEIKFSFSGGNIVGPILLAMDGIAPLNTLHERVTQMKIDKNSQFNVAGQSGSFMDFLNMMGVSNEQLAAIPRITKEEFYAL